MNLGTIMGWMRQDDLADKHHKRTLQYMGHQFQNQKKLNLHGNQMSKAMFDYTFMPTEKIRERGLNPALVYNGSGAGGSTTSSSGGAAASGAANAPMDISQAAEVALVTAQAKKINAETKNIEESTSKTYQEGRKTFLENVILDWEMSGENEVINTKSKHYGDAGVTPTSPKGKLVNLTNEEIEQKLSNLKVEEKATKENIKLTKEQTRRIYHLILQDWAKVGVNAINSVNLMKYIKKGKNESN